jgi:hypothetical protein
VVIHYSAFETVTCYRCFESLIDMALGMMRILADVWLS